MSRRWRRARRHRAFVAGFTITAAIVGTALCSLVYTPRDPLGMDIAARLQPPSTAQLMGTDQYGRDVLSRVMRGTVASLAVGAVAVGHRPGPRRPARGHRRLGRRLARRSGDAGDGRDLRVPGGALGAARHGRLRGGCADQHGGGGRRVRADLRAGDARECPDAAGAGLRAGGAGSRGLGRRDRSPAHPAEYRVAADRPGDDLVPAWPSWPRRRSRTWGWGRSRPSRRGDSCSARPRVSWRWLRGSRSSRGPPSPWRCSDSTCSVTASETSWIPGHAERGGLQRAQALVRDAEPHRDALEENGGGRRLGTGGRPGHALQRLPHLEIELLTPLPVEAGHHDVDQILLLPVDNVEPVHLTHVRLVLLDLDPPSVGMGRSLPGRMKYVVTGDVG